MRKVFLFVWEIAKIVIIALIIVLPIRYFLFQPFFVKGESMEPNFENGDYLIIDELSYRLRDPQRGEVIVFKYPQDISQRYIKRIIGLPGETVKIQEGNITILIDGEWQLLEELEYLSSTFYTLGSLEMKLDDNDYFVLGDNRSSSFDSRRWGLLPEEYIVGRVLFRAWPLTSLDKFETPNY